MKWSRYTLSVLGLTVLWGLTAIWGISEVNARRLTANTLQNKYNRSFFESMQRTKNVEVLLSKGLVSGSTEHMDTLLSDLWSNANAAQDNLHQLPLSHNVVAQTSKFLTQVGDYAYALTKRNNKQLSDKDWKTMQQLYGKSENITREMSIVKRQVSSGSLHWSEVQGGLAGRLPTGSTSNADNTFRRIDSSLQGIPTLVYDGPFSDHLDRRQPLGLTGSPVTSSDARRIARKFVDLKGAAPKQTRFAADVKGRIPSYSVEFMMGDRATDVITVNVSKKGGHIVYELYPRQVKSSGVSEKQALDTARRFLASKGYANLVPTYSLKMQNIMVITFADKQGDVIIYPDQIKVQVALDNGQILGFEGMGYLTSHHTRSLPQPVITAGQAQKKVSTRLQVLSERLALIPTSGLNEILTYEFKTKLGGDTFLVYINALNGNEEQILRLLNLPNGTLSL